jgi:hypothetical protein
MYIFATGGGGSGIRIIDIPFDISNPFEFMVWVVVTLAPIAQAMVTYLFRVDSIFPGMEPTSVVQVLLNPVTLGLIWVGQWIKGLLV